MPVENAPFGNTREGKAVEIYILTNAHGMRARVMTYGALLVSLEVPGRGGAIDDVCLGFDSLDGYLEGHPYFGATIGRYGNRIAKGKFTLDGAEYVLAVNNGENHLHGGLVGFDKKVWDAAPVDEEGVTGVRFTCLSPGGEEGYPGNLSCSVTYILSEDNELRLEYAAATDKATPVNLTNHSYFNLSGEGNGDILGHIVEINASRYTAVDDGLIPTGELTGVTGGPLDFRQPHAISARAAEMTQTRGGYDHNFVLDSGGGVLARAARVFEPSSGRVMEVLTTEPGMQFYTGNFLDGIAGKGGKKYEKQYAFCMETQHFPDSPNHPEFPSTILRPGEEYTQTTVYRFGAE